MKKNYLSYLLSIALLSPSLSVASPYLTDEANPVDYKKWELEVSTSYTHPHGGPDEKSVEAEFKYGFMPDVDVFFTVGYEHINKETTVNEEEVVVSPSLRGWGDSEAGFKYRFFKETTYLPQVAIAPAVGLPVGNSHTVGNGRVWYELPLWLEKNWQSWSTSGGMGMVFNSADDNKDYFFAGWKVQNDVTDKLNLGTEIFYQGKDTTDGESVTLLNVGAIYQLTEVVSLQCSVGRSIHGQAQTIAYLGFSLS